MRLDIGRFDELLLRIAVERGIGFDPRPDGVDEGLARLAQAVDRLAVAVAVIASPQGVLVVRRRGHVPP
jgi:hypothetical protein